MTDETTHPYDRYVAAINHADFDERLRGLATAAHDTFAIRSPQYEAHGLREICEAVGRAMSAGGARVTLRRHSAIDEHHNIGRVEFEALDSAGNRLTTGLHIFERSGDRLAALAVFIGASPPPK